MHRELRILHRNEPDKKSKLTRKHDLLNCFASKRIYDGAFQSVVNLDVAEAMVDEKGGAYAPEATHQHDNTTLITAPQQSTNNSASQSIPPPALP
jgi:hypothetical protein